MSDSDTPPNADNRFREPDTARCPNCDSVIKRGDARCLMCGERISQDVFVNAAAKAAKDALRHQRELVQERLRQERESKTVQVSEEPEKQSASSTESNTIEQVTVTPTDQTHERETLNPDVVLSGHRSPADFGQKAATPLSERIQPPPVIAQSNDRHPTTPLPPATTWRPTPIFAFFVLGIIAISICGIFGLRMVDETPAVTPSGNEPTAESISVASNPTSRPSAVPEDISTATPTITLTPTVTRTPFPTDTPQPPRFHSVATGETIISIALLYGVTVDSIAETNGINPDSIQGGQDLQIPWPTATPPLQPILVEIGEDSIVVDPGVCPPFYEIQDGDNIFSIAAQNNVPFDAMLSINRLTIDTVLRSGDVICIPQIDESGVLPPTPGPSPTASNTPAPAGAQLLYPPNGTTVENPDATIALQWLAVKNLQPDEQYMVEVTNLSDPTSHPHRGFTRSNSFQIPAVWRATINEVHEFRWRISIIQVTGIRADGTPIYTYGGRTSIDATFFWLGVIPTATIVSTPSPTLTPSTNN